MGLCFSGSRLRLISKRWQMMNPGGTNLAWTPVEPPSIRDHVDVPCQSLENIHVLFGLLQNIQYIAQLRLPQIMLRRLPCSYLASTRALGGFVDLACRFGVPVPFVLDLLTLDTYPESPIPKLHLDRPGPLKEALQRPSPGRK